jgi:putative oxidoreductase
MEVNTLVIESLVGTHASLASLLLRLMVGSTFIVHGYPKLKDGGKGAGGWLKSLGVPSGFGLFAGVVEFFGGVALLLGLFTPLIAALFGLWMLALVWLSVSKIKKKFVGGWELDFLLLVGSLAIGAVGSGAFSLDHLLAI